VRKLAACRLREKLVSLQGNFHRCSQIERRVSWIRTCADGGL